MNEASADAASSRAGSPPAAGFHASAANPSSPAAFASPEPDAERQVLQQDDRETLIAALSSLGERHQLVIQLYFVEELNLSEIAAVLGVSVPRVHQLKAAALAQMRKAMADR